MSKAKPKVVDLCVVFLAGALLACGGCGARSSDKYVVTGTVTFDGQPISKGYLTFKPADPNSAADGGEVLNGQFRFLAKPGMKQVIIDASRPGPIDPEMESPTQVPYIPAKYNKKTELTAEVKPNSENYFEFALSSG